MRREHQRGFSILEAVISAAVLGIGMVGLINLHTSSMRGEARAVELSRAQSLVRQVADYYSASGFDRVSDAAVLGDCTDAPQACGPGTAAPTNAVAPCSFWAGRDWSALHLDNDQVDTRAPGAQLVQLQWVQSTTDDSGTLLVSACNFDQNWRGQGAAVATRVVMK